MSKTIHIPGGTITLAESRAVCPYCQALFPFNFIERKWMQAEKRRNVEHSIKIKCSCLKMVMICIDYKAILSPINLENNQ